MNIFRNRLVNIKKCQRKATNLPALKGGAVDPAANKVVRKLKFLNNFPIKTAIFQPSGCEIARFVR
jgi:superfamily II RNA helicase